MRRQKDKRYRGAALAEAAIVMTLVVAPLTLGAIEYGWLFFNLQQVKNAARQGARIAILPHATAQAEARTLITQLLDDFDLVDDTTVTLTEEPIPGGPAGRTQITVKITLATANVRIVNATFLPVRATIECMVTMAREGS